MAVVLGQGQRVDGFRGDRLGQPLALAFAFPFAPSASDECERERGGVSVDGPGPIDAHAPLVVGGERI